MRGFRGALAAAAIATVSLIAVPGAGAVGYEVSGTITDPGLLLPSGVSVDPARGNVYVGNLAGADLAPGQIFRFDPEGAPLSPATMGSGYFGGVAVSGATGPGEGNVYGWDTALAGFGPPGLTASIDTFDALGVAVGSPFEVPFQPFYAYNPQIASDSAGAIYFVNDTTNVVQKFTPAGTAGTPASFECAGAACDATALSSPNGVALDSSGNVYVADTGNERVVKFNSAGVFQSVFYSGASKAVAVDTSNGNVFVGGDDGSGYHITALDSAGTPIGGIGTGTITDDPGNLIHPQIAVNPTSGVLYVTQGDSMVPANSVVYIFSPLPPPTATTGAASAITQTTAALAATVNPKGGDTTDCHLEWGPAAGEYNTGSAPCTPDPGSANANKVVSGAATALTASTTYHYRVVIETEGGEAQGTDKSFTTLPPAPTATSEAATGATQSAATLHGTVDAEGDSAECKFEYGTTTAYGASVPCSPTPVTGTAATAVSAVLSGLSAGTTYHFRVVATNKGGPTNGTGLTFTTQSAPPPPSGGGSTPPVTTPPVTTPPPKKPLKCKKGFKKKTVKGKKKCVKIKKKGKKH